MNCTKVEPQNLNLKEQKMNEETEQLITNESAPKVKPCAYPSCNNTIPFSSADRYCDVCRTLAIRNAITICIDPTSPITERRDNIFKNALHNLRPEELLALVQNAEYVYLECQKAIKANQLALPSARFNSGSDEINKMRSQSGTPKTKKKYETRKKSNKEKLTNLFGSEEAAKEIMDMDLSDL